MFMSSMVPRLFEVEASYSFIVSGRMCEVAISGNKREKGMPVPYSLCIPESGGMQIQKITLFINSRIKAFCSSKILINQTSSFRQLMPISTFH